MSVFEIVRTGLKMVAEMIVVHAMILNFLLIVVYLGVALWSRNFSG